MTAHHNYNPVAHRVINQKIKFWDAHRITSSNVALCRIENTGASEDTESFLSYYLPTAKLAVNFTDCISIANKSVND